MMLTPAAADFAISDVNPDASRTDADRLRFRWKQAINRVNAFKASFYRDYLALIATRQKWRTSEPDIIVNEIVLIVDETIKRKDWSIGRITETMGTGPHVRRVKIRKPNGDIIERDRTGVVTLELE